MGPRDVVPSPAYITKVAACPICYSLDKARRPRKEFLSSIPDFGGTFWSFSVSLKDASSAGEAGCQFCEVLSKIFWHILTPASNVVNSADASVDVFVPVDTERYWEFRVEFRYSAAQAGTGLLQSMAKTFYLTTIRKYQEGPLKTLPKGGYVPSNPLSELILRKISSWLRECISGHSSIDCSSRRLGASRYWPMRLIAVGAWASMPKIVEPQGLVADYTALSYCWGDANIPLTTTANLSERRQGLRWDCLPKVFQDAIVLTRVLGIKHIWIDAICIIQDDAADLSTQLSQMAQIYHEALLVISADSARSANDRLFKERRESLRLQTEPMNKSNKASEVLLHEGIDHQFLGGPNIAGGSWPLATRGWTLQERFLATRIIHISTAEAVWECNEKLHCECKYMDQRGRNREALTWTSLRSRYIHNLDANTSGDQRAECWCYIVREYSCRLCSKDVDRLPAISGLARQFGTAGIGEYRAGVWTKYVLRMISWNRNPDDNLCRRPTEYTAPSWSWVSIVGQIDWEFSKDWDFGDSVPEVSNSQFVAHVLNLECRPSSEDVFGRVSSGHLTISSPSLQVAVRDSGGSRELDLDVDYTLILDVTYPKGFSELPYGGVVTCVFLENIIHMDVPALVLKSCGLGVGGFQRIGRLFVHERDKLPKLTTEVLTIY